MHLRLFQTVLVLLVGAVLFSACVATPQAQSPTSAPAQPETIAATTDGAAAAPAASEDAIRAGIQQTLDRYAEAYNTNDPDLLKQTTDQTNAPFRRYVDTRFENFQESIFAGQVDFGYRVREITQLDHGFVRAQVERTWDGNVEDWLLREVDGTWLLSEPTEQQIGERTTRESEHFIYYTYPWADQITPTIMELMEEAYAEVQQKLGKVPDGKMKVYIKPIFGLPPPEDPGALAYRARGRKPQDDRMVIFAPGSMIFTAYNPATGWEPMLRTVLIHEYAHQVNDRSFTPIARMSDWMVEGLADYVADNRREGAVAAAVRADNIIPIVDTTTGRIDKQDLEHLTLLDQDIPLAYGFSSSLVAYIVETYGGLDGWWKFANAFDKSQDIDTALQNAFGVNYKQFDQDWRAWLRDKYA